MADATDVGAFTGLWLMASGLGNFVCQSAIGFLMDRLGYQWIFYGSGLAVLLGFVALLGTRERTVMAVDA